MKLKRSILAQPDGSILINAIMGMAISSIMGLTLLQLANQATQIQSLSMENSEILDQIYIAKMMLAEPNTCRLNLAGTEVSNKQIKIDKPLMNVEPGSTTLGTKPIFPTQDSAPGLPIHFNGVAIIGSDQIATIAKLVVEFKRGKHLGETSIFRNIPLRVTLDASQKIVECTAGDNLSTPLAAGTAVAKSGWDNNCDDLAAPNSSEDTSVGAAKAGYQAQLAKFCDGLTYPTPATVTINCTDLTAYNTTGAYATNMISVNSNPIYRAILNNESSTSHRTCYKSLESKALGGLSSASDCKSMPLFPEGTQVEGSKAGGQYTSPTGLVTGAYYGGTSYLCVNSKWVKL